jgi:hypothetical protein
MMSLRGIVIRAAKIIINAGKKCRQCIVAWGEKKSEDNEKSPYIKLKTKANDSSHLTEYIF